ncbi:hypothetical protein [Carnobacterium pleistocenium]|nr:hypothetical protein [Carnobacterium pleistocenium]
MEALHVNAELRMAAKRQNITQLNLSKKLIKVTQQLADISTVNQVQLEQ